MSALEASKCPTYYLKQSKFHEYSLTCNETNLRFLAALVNCETDLSALQETAKIVLAQALKHTGDDTCRGGYLLLDEGNGEPVIIPVGMVAEDRVEEYSEVALAKWQWLRDNPNAHLSRENTINPFPRRIEKYKIDVPAGAAAFERKEKRAIIAFSDLKEDNWNEAVVLKIAEDMGWITREIILDLAEDNPHLLTLLREESA